MLLEAIVISKIVTQNRDKIIFLRKNFFSDPKYREQLLRKHSTKIKGQRESEDPWKTKKKTDQSLAIVVT